VVPAEMRWLSDAIWPARELTVATDDVSCWLDDAETAAMALEALLSAEASVEPAVSTAVRADGSVEVDCDEMLSQALKKLVKSEEMPLVLGSGNACCTWVSADCCAVSDPAAPCCARLCACRKRSPRRSTPVTTTPDPGSGVVGWLKPGNWMPPTADWFRRSWT
jgi:hypothetical protein